jgi:hypothetical protein
MTRRDLSLFCIHNDISMSPEEIDDALRSANMDPDEGADWLPYYKAALGFLAQCVGALSAGAKVSDPHVARLWELHLLLCGIGPDRNIVRAARSKAAVAEEMAAFVAAPLIARRPDLDHLERPGIADRRVEHGERA